MAVLQRRPLNPGRRCASKRKNKTVLILAVYEGTVANVDLEWVVERRLECGDED